MGKAKKGGSVKGGKTGGKKPKQQKPEKKVAVPRAVERHITMDSITQTEKGSREDAGNQTEVPCRPVCPMPGGDVCPCPARKCPSPSPVRTCPSPIQYPSQHCSSQQCQVQQCPAPAPTCPGQQMGCPVALSCPANTIQTTCPTPACGTPTDCHSRPGTGRNRSPSCGASDPPSRRGCSPGPPNCCRYNAGPVAPDLPRRMTEASVCPPTGRNESLDSLRQRVLEIRKRLYNDDQETPTCQKADNAMYQAANIVGYTKNHMNARDIAGMQDNQVRQRHHEAIDNLRGGEQGMAPFAHHSIDRLKQYADYAGVTDRYTGYRNNLNRGSQEAGRMGPSWVDHQTQYNPYNSPSRTPRCQNGGGPQFDYGGPSPTCNRGWPDEAQKCCTKAASNPRNCADSAGINTSFPGMSWGYS